MKYVEEAVALRDNLAAATGTITRAVRARAPKPAVFQP